MAASLSAQSMITTGTYGEETRLIPHGEMKATSSRNPHSPVPPGTTRLDPRLQGRRSCMFELHVARPVREWMLLGVIALRVEGKLEWDAAKMRFSNNADANKYLKRRFAKAGR